MNLPAKTNDQAGSRAGDRYHYLYAARLAMTMLDPNASLRRIVVEGSAEDDLAHAGEAVIDLALYYEDVVNQGEWITYCQFKHSIVIPPPDVTISSVTGTLEGFAKRYKDLPKAAASSCRFEFTTNRALSDSLEQALKALRKGEVSDDSDTLRAKIDLDPNATMAFAKQVHMVTETPDMTGLRRLLLDDARAYLPGDDKNAPIRLVNLIADCAAEKSTHSRELTRHDVLDLMGCNEGGLRPAPPSFDPPEKVVHRPCIDGLTAQIIAAERPVILSAGGGVGKSVVTATLADALPPGSVCIAYDCFAQGSYRNPAIPRHQPKQALVQIVNEMAQRGLCDPLIPSSAASANDYHAAFTARIEQAANSVSGKPDAILIIIVDAADNAEMVARDNREVKAFAAALLRTTLPDKVRLVLTTRPERSQLLDPPHDVVSLTLPEFIMEETAQHLRLHHPEATDLQVDAFHRMSSANPRVQARLLERDTDLHTLLTRAQGPGTSKTVQDTIEGLLNRTFDEACDDAGAEEKEAMVRICQAFAVLRPFIPLNILANVAGAHPDLVRSVTTILGETLIIESGMVQIADEPTETWLRGRFRPDTMTVKEIVEALRPHAENDPYAAMTLPRLMLEAGELDALIALALSDRGLLPRGHFSRHDVELMRLQTATQAALKAERYADAARLAFKTAGTVADESRRFAVLSEHPDLAARFVDSTTAQGYLAAGRIQGGDWTGSDEAYEAAFYAGYSQLRGAAAVRLATARDWMHHHLDRLQDEDQFNLSNEDIAAMAWTVLELYGTRALVRYLSTWRPRILSFDIGMVIVERLADAGRVDDLLALADHADANAVFGLAVNLAATRIGLTLPTAILLRWRPILWDMRFAPRQSYEHFSSSRKGYESLAAGVAFVAALAPHAPNLTPELVAFLGRILPRDPGGRMNGYGEDEAREAILRGVALHCALSGTPFTLDRLVPHGESIGPEHSGNHTTRMLYRDVSRLLPLHVLRADAVLGRVSRSDIGSVLQEAMEASRPSTHTYIGEYDDVRDEQVLLQSEILLLCGAAPDAWEGIENQDTGDSFFGPAKPQKLRPSTIARLVWGMAARADLHGRALDMAAECRMRFEDDPVEVDAKIRTMLSLSRATLRIDEAEARALFEMATTVEGQYGEETIERWNALLGVAEAAARDEPDDAQLAYRLARLAEPVEDSVGSKYFDSFRTVCCLSALSPPSAAVILSRWADRGFGNDQRNVSTALHALHDAGHMDAQTVLLLYPALGLDAHETLDRALVAGVPDAMIDDIARRYIRLETTEPYEADRVRAVARRHGRSWPWLASLPESESERYVSTHANERKASVVAALDALDLSTESGMRQGFAAMRYHYDYEALIARIPAGRETALLAALVDVSEIERSDLDQLALTIPDGWKTRAAYPAAMRSLAIAVLRRDPFTPDVSRLAARTGVSERDLNVETLAAVAEGEGGIGYAALFHLTVLCCRATDAPTSRAVLSDLLDVMAPSLAPEDGDGSWHNGLMPTGKSEVMVMAYLWATLGAPDPTRRWEAIHAVRCIGLWGDTALLGHLFRCATGDLNAPVHDSRLSFYSLNALEGLLIALARVAVDVPGRIAEAVPLLETLSDSAQNHAVLRGLAATLRIALHRAGIVVLLEDEHDRLASINDDRRMVGPAPPSNDDEERLYYPYEIRKHRLSPIAFEFSLSEDDAERRCIAIMRKLASDDPHLEPDAEPRRDLPHFRHERDRKQQRRHEYLARHGTLIFLGRLLDGEEPCGERRGDANAADLLDGDRGTAAPDGRWRADRRDPAPAPCLIEGARRREDWLAELDHLDPAPFRTISGETVLWGHWHAKMSGQVRTVSINSALVSRDTAPALVRALSNARSSHDYAIPLAGNHGEILHPGFVMKGWVDLRHHQGEGDKYDPWAKLIPSEILEPAAWVRDRLCLTMDPDGMRWTGPDGTSSLSLHCWSTKERDSRERDNGGQYLSACPGFAGTLSATTGMMLLREVIVRHRIDTRRPSGNEDDTRAKVFLDLLGEGA